jgi:DNA (cytosine-5)-methyltransferase 1
MGVIIPKKVIKYIDLCSGIGGFRIAINNISDICDAKCVLSCDIKQSAIDTYNLNFNEQNEKTNIYDLKAEEIESFDLLCAGFCCQPFSSAGNKKGFSDERGGIIFKIIELCKYHRPNYVFLENVYNLITIKNGECIDRIVKLFEDLGYYVNYKKLNSKDFGLPQDRQRVYIICCLEKKVFFENIKQFSPMKLNEIIDYNDKNSKIDKSFTDKLLELNKTRPIYGCKIGDKRGGSSNIHSWDINYSGKISEQQKELMNQILLERRKKHWADIKNIDWMDGMPLTKSEIETFNNSENLQQMLDNLVELKYLRLEKCKHLVNGSREYKEDSEEGYNICKGKLSFPISKILDPEGICPTLTATDSNKLALLIENNTIRQINKKEIKKICGFPDTFQIPNNVNYFDLFGNMATPPVLEELFRIMLAEF